MRTRLPLMGPQTPRRCDVLRCGHWPVRLGVIRRVQPAGLAAENRPWHWPSSGGTVSRERCPIVRSLWRPSELGLERSQAYFKYVFLIYVTEFCANSIIRRSGMSFGHFHENSRCKQLKLRGKKIKNQDFFLKPPNFEYILRFQCTNFV